MTSLSDYYRSVANIYAYDDYREWIRFQLRQNDRERGYQARLAKAAGCKSSFLSQVLHTHVQLTPDQAAGLADFWNFDTDESDYFLNLLFLERAATPSLRKMCLRRVTELKEKQADFAKRYRKDTVVRDEQALKYYSSWQLVAIHVLLTIPDFRSAKAIATRLELSLKSVELSLKELQQMGLAVFENSEWRAGQKNIHLTGASPLHFINHANWRHRAFHSLQKGGEDRSLHYTAVHSLSHRDIEQIRQLILKLIDQIRDVVDPSPEEELVAFTCDFFRV